MTRIHAGMTGNPIGLRTRGNSPPPPSTLTATPHPRRCRVALSTPQSTTLRLQAGRHSFTRSLKTLRTFSTFGAATAWQ
jgi:hypothetical protein